MNMPLNITPAPPRRHEAQDVFTASFLSARETPEASISYDGHHYLYHGYSYDRLADAVDYIRQTRTHPWWEDQGGPFTPNEVDNAPTLAEQKLMAALAVYYEAGHYRFQNFRYDRQADALNYASLAWKQQKEAGGWDVTVNVLT